jgi:excisionase family DNA binding protein
VPAARVPEDGILSLGPASRLLGVNPDTLRRWADVGRVASFATPGGHRRFSRAELSRLAAARSMPRQSLSRLGATPERLARAYARSYRSGEDLRSTRGFERVDRDRFRDEGRRLVGALLAYLDAPSAAARRRCERDAAEAVRATGRRLAAIGVDLEGAIATFVGARRPFMAELATIGRRRALDAGAITSLYDDATALLDRLLLELVGGFRTPMIDA